MQYLSSVVLQVDQISNGFKIPIFLFRRTCHWSYFLSSPQKKFQVRITSLVLAGVVTNSVEVSLNGDKPVVQR